MRLCQVAEAYSLREKRSEIEGALTDVRCGRFSTLVGTTASSASGAVTLSSIVGHGPVRDGVIDMLTRHLNEVNHLLRGLGIVLPEDERGGSDGTAQAG